MFKFLNKPYPAPDCNPGKIWIAVGVGLFVAFTLILLEPFDLNLLQIPFKTLKVLGFGVITFLIVTFFQLIVPRFSSSFFHEKNWKTYKEILYLGSMILVIGIVNGLYGDFVINGHLHWSNFVSYIKNTFLLGAIPSAFFIMMNYVRLSHQYQTLSKTIHPEEKILNPDAAQVSAITIVGVNEGEKIDLPADQLLFISSDSNYVTIRYLQSGKVSESLFRSTLSQIEVQLMEQHEILRCHRSYIVNLGQVKSVTGNAQGLQLSIDAIPTTIPVSRKFVGVVRNWFKLQK